MPSKLSPEERRLRSEIANLDRWSNVPFAERSSQTQAARDARFAKHYLDKVDPERKLDEDERYALARMAEKADMKRMRLAAVRKRREAQEAAERAGEAGQVAS